MNILVSIAIEMFFAQHAFVPKPKHAMESHGSLIGGNGLASDLAESQLPKCVIQRNGSEFTPASTGSIGRCVKPPIGYAISAQGELHEAERTILVLYEQQMTMSTLCLPRKPCATRV